VVKKLNLYHNSYNIDPPPFELPLQLARKKFRTLGYAAFEDELLNQYTLHPLSEFWGLKRAEVDSPAPNS